MAEQFSSPRPANAGSTGALSSEGLALCDCRQEGQRLIVAIQPQSQQLSEGSGTKLSLSDYLIERVTGLSCESRFLPHLPLGPVSSQVPE